LAPSINGIKGYKLDEDVKLLIKNSLSFRYDKDLILFTDLPFFDEVQYMELSFFYKAWLRESKFKNVVKEILGENVAFRMRYEIIVNLNKVNNYATLKLLDKFLLKTRKTKSKYLLFFPYDNDELKQKIISLAKVKRIRIKIEDIEIGTQRNIGTRGGKKYILVYS